MLSAKSSMVLKSLDRFYDYCKHVTSTTDLDNPQKYTIFHSATEPQVKLRDYVLRIARAMDCGTECVLLAFVLIGRYSVAADVCPSVLTAHRLFVTALRIVTKVQFDLNRSNRSFAAVGGLRPIELARLERGMLAAVNYDVVMRQEDLDYITAALQAVVEAPNNDTNAHCMAVALKIQSPLKLASLLDLKRVSSSVPASPLAHGHSSKTSCYAPSLEPSPRFATSTTIICSTSSSFIANNDNSVHHSAAGAAARAVMAARAARNVVI